MVDTGKGKKTALYELAQVKTSSESFSIEVQSDFPNVSMSYLSIKKKSINSPCLVGKTCYLAMTESFDLVHKISC